MTRAIALLLATTLTACVTKNADLDAVGVDVAAREVTGHETLAADAAAGTEQARALREQGNLEASLIAFRLAEDRAAEEDRPRLQLEQATILRLMELPGGALEVLQPLFSSPDPEVRRPALALAGVIHGERDDLTRAEDLLRRAVEGDDRWSGQAAALHDLGVVLLRRGQERPGLAMLERARARHAADGDDAGVADVLRTEAAYWRVKREDEVAERLLREAERLAGVR